MYADREGDRRALLAGIPETRRITEKWARVWEIEGCWRQCETSLNYVYKHLKSYACCPSQTGHFAACLKRRSRLRAWRSRVEIHGAWVHRIVCSVAQAAQADVLGERRGIRQHLILIGGLQRHRGISRSTAAEIHANTRIEKGPTADCHNAVLRATE